VQAGNVKAVYFYMNGVEPCHSISAHNNACMDFKPSKPGNHANKM